MSRPRKTKLTAVRFVAHRDGQSETFTSRREALKYLAQAKRSSRLEETYFAVRGWLLSVERVPKGSEEPNDPESFSGHKLTEEPFIVKGPDSVELMRRAEAMRRESFAKHWLLFTSKAELAQLSRESRQLALEVVDLEYARLDAGHDRFVAKEAVRKERAKEANIPTLIQAFEEELKRKVAKQLVVTNTAEVYRYEATAFDIEVAFGTKMVPLRDIQIHKLTEGMIREWADAYSLTDTRYGKPPGTKSCINIMGRLQMVREGIKRRPEYRQYAEPLKEIDLILEELHEGSRDGDGWRRRRRFSNEAITSLIICCKSDLERAALALLLAGCRPPSEAVAAQWDHVEKDLDGNLWWHVNASAIELVGGKLELREGKTKTKDVDFRQLNVCKGLADWIEKRRGLSPWVLGIGNSPMAPSELVRLFNDLVARAKVGGESLSVYSMRHTVSDEVERILGRRARDLVLHGKRDRTTGGMYYSHADRDRRRAELVFDGKSYGEHMAWVGTIPEQ